MRVSIILPCRNEARRLGPCLDSILAGTWPVTALEVLVVDGESDDESRQVAAGYARRHPAVIVLRNARRSAPAAMNIGIAHATGDVIVRMDAHVLYPADYVERLVAHLARGGADNVGGRVETIPDGDGVIPRAIARAMAHPFGVGNSHFRLRSSQPRFVDTVPFGCWRRGLFARIGGFDEDLIRNQDDEFNARIIRRGGRVLLDPTIVARYFARPTLRKLARMYFQYGLFKPLVVRKCGALTSVRQLAPAAFVLAIVTAALGALAWPPLALALAAVLGTYGAAAIVAAASASRDDGFRGTLARTAAFAVMHFAYGVGYLRGIVQPPAPATLGAPVTAFPLSR